ncbi:MAG: Crp/Fnr family transcriptional regulator, partial [Treponema sp.]|nr:Crp/Fnr family transcriptional regulator [Treponema sp.]
IFTAGDKAGQVGIVLSGAVYIMREDFWGRRKILSRVEGGGLFGESFACASLERLPVSVMAAQATEILFIDIEGILSPRASALTFHEKLIGNLAILLAKKNIALIRKLENITQTTTREKLLSYLSDEAKLAGKSVFSIPFNREELADYLSVERSAMSAELSRMRADGLLLYRKNHFQLLEGAKKNRQCSGIFK